MPNRVKNELQYRTKAQNNSVSQLGISVALPSNVTKQVNRFGLYRDSCRQATAELTNKSHLVYKRISQYEME